MEGLSKLTNNAKKVLKLSYENAKENNQSHVELENLLLTLFQVEEGIASKVLKGLSFEDKISKLLEKNIEKYSNQGELKSKDIILSEDYITVLENSYNIARKFYHVYVGTEHLLLGILAQKNNIFVKNLHKIGFTYDYAEKFIVSYANYPLGLLTKLPEQDEKSNSILNSLGRNLVEYAKNHQMDKILGRDKEINRLIHILERRSKNNPLLIGEAGVGKTAIVEGLAQRIAQRDVPEDLIDSELWLLDVFRLMASTEMRGDLESKIMALIDELNSKKNVIIFIDEIHTIINNSVGNNDIGSIIKPYLTRGVFKCIGATTISEYQKYFETDTALNRRFQPIFVEEISEATSIEILNSLKKDLEDYHKIKITNESISDAVKLSSKYISDRFLPDKAIDLIDEAAAKVKMDQQILTPDIRDINSKLISLEKNKEDFINQKKYVKAIEIREEENKLKMFLDQAVKNLKRTRKSTKYIVNDEIVKEVISSWTGIPLSSLSISDKNSLRNLDKNIKKRVIGQDNAVSRVVHSIRTARLGIKNSNRALASFLFLGPTGVGKTELSKQLALNLFGDLKSFIQIDMSEYMESHTVSKFIGSPPGYVGFQEGGQLTEKVRRRPYSVILFDEIEKAHIDVLNILLQILEEGHLTDSKGRLVSFKNAIIILTSNIGANKIKNDSRLGFNISNLTDNSENILYQEMKDIIIEELKEYLTPEFINRLDDIVVFRSLNKLDINKISEKLLNDLKSRLKDSKLNFTYDADVVSYISDKGFSTEYGARPINRVIEEYIEFILADKLLMKDLGKKNYNIKASIVNNNDDKNIKIEIDD